MRKTVLLIPLLLLACSDNERMATNASQEKPPTSSAETKQPVSQVPDINTPVAALPEEIDHYTRELANIQNNPNAGQGVYGLWKLGKMASKALTQSPIGGGTDILERLSDEQYKDVTDKMKGYFINRQEAVFAEPDPAFFLALAKRTQEYASIEFFEALSKIKPGKGWDTVYIQQQTDITGCYRFGSMSLLETYTILNTYKNKHPSHYTDEINEVLRDLLFALGNGTCACDSAKLAMSEFEAFIQAHPNANITPRLRERVNQYKQGKSDLRENCISG